MIKKRKTSNWKVVGNTESLTWHRGSAQLWKRRKMEWKRKTLLNQEWPDPQILNLTSSGRSLTWHCESTQLWKRRKMEWKRKTLLNQEWPDPQILNLTSSGRSLTWHRGCPQLWKRQEIPLFRNQNLMDLKKTKNWKLLIKNLWETPNP